MPRRRSSLPEPAAVGVSFQHGGKVYYFKPSGVTVQPGDHVLAKTERGIDIGEVVLLKRRLEPQPEDKPLKPLVRRATRDDLLREEILRRRARESLRACEGKVEAHNLPMKLISADYAFDGRRLTFFFSSETRVDFRALVKDLTDMFHCRIELRQIGVRDEAKMIGGLGPCGRPLCCAQWLRSFSPVGIRVAKDQGMSLNPAKISGVCDRLMCCLLYEHSVYTDLAERMPRHGDEVRGQGRTGKVTDVILLRERVRVVFMDGDPTDPVEIPASDLRRSKGYWRLVGTLPEKPTPAGSSSAPPPASERASQRGSETSGQDSRRGVVMREPRRREIVEAPADIRPVAPGTEEAPTGDAADQAGEGQKAAGRSRRRPRKRSSGQAAPEQKKAEAPAEVKPEGAPATPDEQARKSRSPRRRGRRDRKPEGAQATERAKPQAVAPPATGAQETGGRPEGSADKKPDGAGGPRRRRRPRRSGGKPPEGGAAPPQGGGSAGPTQ